MRDDSIKRRYRARSQNGRRATILVVGFAVAAALLYVSLLSAFLRPAARVDSQTIHHASVMEGIVPVTTQLIPPTTNALQPPTTIIVPTVSHDAASTHHTTQPTSLPTKQLSYEGSGNCPVDGLDLPTGKEHGVMEQPGGSEGAALEERRKLSRANWPLKRSPSSVQWTSNQPDGSDTYTKCLLSTTQRELVDVALPAVDIIAKCGVGQFRCSIAEYSKRIRADPSRWPHWDSTKCDSVYGEGLLKRFQDSTKSMCTNHQSGTESKLQCKRIVAHLSHEIPTSICRGSHVVVDYSRIGDGDYPWLQFQEGAFDVRGGCHVPPQSTTDFMHCQADWMSLGLVSDPSSKVAAAGGNDAVVCDAVVDSPTLFVTRSGDFSPFAMTHDWLNTVLLAAVEGWTPDNISIIVMDRMGYGFYGPVWQYAFSTGHPVQWFPDLKEIPSQQRVCYRDMWFNIPARLSPIYNEDDCVGPSPLYYTYRDHLLNTFGSLLVVAPIDEIVVTVIERKNYATGHSIGRRLGNLKALLAYLRRELRANRVAARVNVVDYAAHSFGTQLNISRATDVLVAMHGAGLAHIMFLHSWGAVFEFFCPEKPPSNFRYHELSKKMGLTYDSFNIEREDNHIHVEAAGPKIVSLARHVQSQKRNALQRR